MATVINLNKARKARDKAAARTQAAARRAAHGRTKSEKAREEAEKAKLSRLLDQSKLDP